MANSPDETSPRDTDEALTDPDMAHDSASGAAESSQQQGLSQDVQQLQVELEEARNRILRSQAELENFRRRSQREMQDGRRFASQSLLLDLLPALDNMERAIEAAGQNPDSSGLLEGFKMVRQLLLSTLEKHNCRPVPAQGVTFDPTLHEAVAQMPSPDHPVGTVIQVAQQGYQLHDRVIRPAQVVVSSAPPADRAG